jgi:hypothetical protein
MSQTIQANPRALVESVARNLPPSARDDFRNLLNETILANLIALSPGGNLIQIGGSKTGSSAAPVGVTHSVVGVNGVATVNITNPPSAKTVPIYHEISYSPLKSFTQDVTTLPPTTATSVTIPQSGVNAFYRLRSSYDKVSWSKYQFPTSGPVAVDAGLVQATAMTSAAAFNQTNFAEVNSQAAGSAAAITIGGASGPLTSYTAVRGTTQSPRPSGTIVGVEPSSTQFVGWDGARAQFIVKATLASIIADGFEPVGAVSVVSDAIPSLPTIVPIISGGSIVGYDVTNGGTGASQPYTLTIFDSGGGTGATAGAQTIVGGVLLAVAPGNAGSGYSGATTVTPTGGSPGGQGGGGTASGGNAGRFVDIDLPR